MPDNSIMNFSEIKFKKEYDFLNRNSMSYPTLLYYYFCPPEITNKLFKLKLIRLFLLTNLLLF